MLHNWNVFSQHKLCSTNFVLFHFRPSVGVFLEGGGGKGGGGGWSSFNYTSSNWTICSQSLWQYVSMMLLFCFVLLCFVVFFQVCFSKWVCTKFQSLGCKIKSCVTTASKWVTVKQWSCLLNDTEDWEIHSSQMCLRSKYPMVGSKVVVGIVLLPSICPWTTRKLHLGRIQQGLSGSCSR